MKPEQGSVFPGLRTVLNDAMECVWAKSGRGSEGDKREPVDKKTEASLLEVLRQLNNQHAGSKWINKLEVEEVR